MRVDPSEKLAPKQRAIRESIEELRNRVDEWVRTETEIALRHRKEIIARLKESAARAAEEDEATGNSTGTA
jgi:hypothetical protein